MATLQELLASQLSAETAPLRGATLSTLQQILGGAPASTLPAYAPERAAIEGQYNVGLQQARSILPRGGQLNRAMLDLGRERGRAVTGLESALRGQAMNQASQIGFGLLPTIGSLMGSGERLRLAQDASRQQAQNQLVGNIGMGLGLLGTLLSGIG